jgi:hypothetical protein
MFVSVNTLLVAVVCVATLGREALAFVPATGRCSSVGPALTRSSAPAVPVRPLVVLKADPEDMAEEAKENAESIVEKVKHGVEDAAHAVSDAVERGADEFDKNVSRDGRMHEQAKDIHNIIKEEKKEY